MITTFLLLKKRFLPKPLDLSPMIYAKSLVFMTTQFYAPILKKINLDSGSRVKQLSTLRAW